MDPVADLGRDGALIERYLGRLGEVLQRLPIADIDLATATIRRAWARGRTLFLMGNGGSAATASHLAVDLAKGLVADGRPRLRAIALTDNVPLLTAYANDVSYDLVFAEQLANFVQPHDVVLAISGSGNSPNVLAAVQLARDSGAITIGLTGFHGGALKGLVDQAIVVPSDNMQLIEDGHMVIAHILFVALRDGPDPSDA
jgi:D-sedoheptulose 7-phosphate isomerase